MFDVGFPELFIVAVLAIVVVGPKDLPKVIRSVMGMIRKVREMGSEFQAGVNAGLGPRKVRTPQSNGAR